MPRHDFILYTYSHCHQMITQQWPKGPQGSLGVTPKPRCFQPTHANLKKAESALVWHHRWGNPGKLVKGGAMGRVGFK